MSHCMRHELHLGHECAKSTDRRPATPHSTVDGASTLQPPLGLALVQGRPSRRYHAHARQPLPCVISQPAYEQRVPMRKSNKGVPCHAGTLVLNALTWVIFLKCPWPRISAERIGSLKIFNSSSRE